MYSNGDSNSNCISEEEMMKAEQLKRRGNELFQMKKYAAAIDSYTEAITESRSAWPVPILNRAIAKTKLFKWREAKDDLERVLTIDRDNVKATYHLGVCVCVGELEYHRASEILEKALFLARAFDETQLDLIWRSLAKAKYLAHLEGAKVRENVFNAIKEKIKPGFVAMTECDTKVLIDTIELAKEKDKRKSAPDALCCSLSLEMFREPVVGPSGNSYEKSAIEQYIKTQKEKFPERKDNIPDPLAPEFSVSLQTLHPNIALRKIVREWLQEQPSYWGEVLSEQEAKDTESEYVAKKMKTSNSSGDADGDDDDDMM